MLARKKHTLISFCNLFSFKRFNKLFNAFIDSELRQPSSSASAFSITEPGYCIPTPTPTPIESSIYVSNLSFLPLFMMCWCGKIYCGSYNTFLCEFIQTSPIHPFNHSSIQSFNHSSIECSTSEKPKALKFFSFPDAALVLGVSRCDCLVHLCTIGLYNCSELTSSGISLSCSHPSRPPPDICVIANSTKTCLSSLPHSQVFPIKALGCIRNDLVNLNYALAHTYMQLTPHMCSIL